MANGIYNSFKNALMRGEIDLLNDEIKVGLISDSFFELDQNHSVLSDVPAVVAAGTLSGKIIDGAFFGADPTTVSNSAGGMYIRSFVLYREKNDPAQSELIAFFGEGAGLPLYLQGSDVLISWPNSGARIFKL